jgi:hypothetical protein
MLGRFPFEAATPAGGQLGASAGHAGQADTARPGVEPQRHRQAGRIEQRELLGSVGVPCFVHGAH